MNVEIYDYRTWQVMPEYMPKELLSSFEKNFHRFDPDHTGIVKTEDLATTLQNMGKNVSVKEVQEILKKLTGAEMQQKCLEFVDFKEYITVLSTVTTTCIPEDEMQMIFQQFDRDHDGFISPGELKSLLVKLGDEISGEELDEMIREADLDGDGKVSYQEFVHLVTNSNGPIEDILTTCKPTEEDKSTDISDISSPMNNSIAQEKNVVQQICQNSELNKTLKNDPAQTSTCIPIGHRRKKSLSDVFLPTSNTSKRRNGRYSMPERMTPEQVSILQTLQEKQTVSKRSFSLSGSASYLRRAFTRKTKQSQS